MRIGRKVSVLVDVKKYKKKTACRLLNQRGGSGVAEFF